MPGSFYSVSSIDPREISFYPASGGPPSMHQILELARTLWPGEASLETLRVVPGINCYYVRLGAPASEPLVPDPIATS